MIQTHRRFPMRAMLALLSLTAGLATVGNAPATPATSFRDSFDTVGPLAGTLPSDPYEIKSGDWEVADIPDTLTGARRVLRQNSRATTPNEPVVFVRDKSFRAVSIQVTAALIDNVNSSSLGIVFRAPILDDTSADANNLYLFSAQRTGVTGGFPTGQSYALFKRVGQGYYLLSNKIVHTWADLTRPAEYKVSMVNGHIQAFVNGRLIIDHTDIPSPDQPTSADPFPGLPFAAGSVGLRTSAARAWFDDLVVVADDASEGRAYALDAYLSHGVGGQTKQGISLSLQNQLAQLGRRTLDTGFVYGDGDFDEAASRALQSPTGAEIGVTLSTVAKEGTVTSISRLAGIKTSFADPDNKIQVILQAAKIDTTVSATCDAVTSAVDIARGFITVVVTGVGSAPDTIIGPVPLSSAYKPNTIVLEQPNLFRIIAHERQTSIDPQRVRSSALVIELPDGEASLPEINVAGVRVLPRTSLGSLPVMRIEIGNAAAARYCAPVVQGA